MSTVGSVTGDINLEVKRKSYVDSHIIPFFWLKVEMSNIKAFIDHICGYACICSGPARGLGKVYWKKGGD